MSEILAQVFSEKEASTIRQVMRRTFARMEVVEEEVEGIELPPGTFPLFRPSPYFEDTTVADWAYRHHVREILARIRAQEDTRPGTEAECLLGLLGASKTAPLIHQGMTAAEELWQRVAPPGIREQGLGELGPTRREKWVGQIEETIAEARHLTRQEWRKLPKSR